jgi:hypothetical protein
MKNKSLEQGRDPTRDPYQDMHAWAAKQSLGQGQKQSSTYLTAARTREHALTALATSSGRLDRAPSPAPVPEPSPIKALAP